MVKNEEVLKKVINTIQKFNLIENNDRLVLGVSGGHDSICMLTILNEIRNQKIINFDLVVAHINHGLRENAKIDEEYVKSFCENLGIECYVLHVDINKMAKEEKLGSEEAGRKARYEFFDEIMKKTSSNKIATAHNLKDNAETIIMNIIRGSGTKGLVGIEKMKDNKYIRPLIELSREDIEEFCEKNELNPRHDESNDENIYTRNKIRNVVLPYIEKEFNPNIVNTLSRMSEIIIEENEFINKETEKAYKNMLLEEVFEKNIDEDVYNNENLTKIILDNKKFKEYDSIIKKKVIFYSIEKIFGTTQGIEKIHVDDMVKLCENNIGNKFLTPNKKTKILVKNSKIYIAKI